MKLRFATWNMANWSHIKYEIEAWEYYTKELDYNVLLFQEVNPNLKILNKAKLVWNEIGEERSWGSGIYSPKHNIKEYAFKNNWLLIRICG